MRTKVTCNLISRMPWGELAVVSRIPCEELAVRIARRWRLRPFLSLPCYFRKSICHRVFHTIITCLCVIFLGGVFHCFRLAAIRGSGLDQVLIIVLISIKCYVHLYLIIYILISDYWYIVKSIFGSTCVCFFIKDWVPKISSNWNKGPNFLLMNLDHQMTVRKRPIESNFFIV